MSRTSFYKGVYFVVVAGGAALLLWVVFYFHFTGVGIGLLVVCLFVPGRILGFYWRDLLRGLRLLKTKNYAESKRHSELFLATLQQKPWLKKLIWLGFGVYS